MGKTIRLLSLILFCGYLFLGFRIFPRYGVPIDEYSQIDLGRVNYERIVTGSLEIQTHYDRHYGPAFEVPLYVVSQIVSQKTGANVIAVRHLSIFLFFAVSVLCFYLFLERVFKHAWYGLAGSLLLALYPRFFAESFYNSKDMVFVGVTVMSMYLLSLLEKKQAVYLVLFSVITGFGIATRVQGVLLFLVYSVTLIGWGRGTVRQRMQQTGIYIVLTLLTAWACFPLFWNNFWDNIIGFWRVSANSVGVATYYLGRFYTSPDLPWHYHFVWIGVSGMLSVIVVSLIGMALFGYRLVKGSKKKDQIPVALLGIIVGTFIVSVFMHPRSYDGWRHIYYVYPSLIYFSLYVLYPLHRIKTPSIPMVARLVCVIFFAIDLITATIFIVNNHPRQYVYFNILAGGYRNAKARFDFDYWGISLREIETYLIHNEWGDTRTIYFDQILPFSEKSMIPSLMKKGIHSVSSIEKADLYVAVFRDFKEPPPQEFFEKVYAVTVEDADVSAIYARR
ncbi:MAG: glycosyltransferase family 39 protein [Patescibacteria group bacterium]